MRQILHIISDDPAIVRKKKRELYDKSLEKLKGISIEEFSGRVCSRNDDKSYIEEVLVILPMLGTTEDGKFDMELQKWQFQVIIEQDGNCNIKKL